MVRADFGAWIPKDIEGLFREDVDWDVSRDGIEKKLYEIGLVLLLYLFRDVAEFVFSVQRNNIYFLRNNIDIDESSPLKSVEIIISNSKLSKGTELN